MKVRLNTRNAASDTDSARQDGLVVNRMGTLRRKTGRYIATIGAVLVLTAIAVPVNAQTNPPTVNGQFYGDGDDAKYIEFATSYLGSKLNVYFDAPGATLYVALVVNPEVNDNVFGQPASPDTNYMTSVGWGGGEGQQRSAAKLTDSEFAEFTFACAPGSTSEWTWGIGYACLSGSTWVSDMTCGSSYGAPPPGLVSATSFAWNMNTYEAAGTKLWNRDVRGSGIADWVSPYDSSQSPPLALGLDGYPSLAGAAFSTAYQYEWRMIYEWSIPLDATGANCGSEPVYVVTGLSHHSPYKEDLVTTHPNCGEEDDCFPNDITSVPPLSDYGDLPDVYGTTTTNSGPFHNLTATGPYLGQAVVAELDGQPTTDATGDGDEEDGVSVVVDSNWTAGSTQSIEVTVANAPSGALLAGWFDWNSDGDVDDAGEYFEWSVSNGTNTLNVVVGSAFDWSSDTLFARFRIFSTAAAAPGGSLSQADSVGEATDGEVEDYEWEAGTLPVTLNSFSSEGAAGRRLTVRWQTASETDNVGFEVWGMVNGTWHVLGDFVPSRGMNSLLSQEYEIEITAPPLLSQLQLAAYRSRGAIERHGPFRVGAHHGEVLPVQRIDWTAPRLEREERLRKRGFQPVGTVADVATRGDKRLAASGAWKKLTHERAEQVAKVSGGSIQEIVVADAGAPQKSQKSITVNEGPMTHVLVTEPGIQRVTYEDLRDGGLDLAGYRDRDIAVTWRGNPVARWIGDNTNFGPGSAIEFVARPPQGDDALYVNANHYQISVDRKRAVDAKEVGWGKVHKVSDSYLDETWVDVPNRYLSQSPTDDPWIERMELARNGVPFTVTLDLQVDGEVLDGAHRLLLGLGTVTDLPDLVDGAGSVIPEHNVEVSFSGPDSGFVPVTAASISGQKDWQIEAEISAGLLEQGLNQIQLRFSTEYLYSLIVVDRYGVQYPAPYRGPTLDFAPDRSAHGYRIEGFEGADIVAYGEQGNGSLTRFQVNATPSGDGFTAELRQLSAGSDVGHVWVTERPHRPAVFTTDAPVNILEGPADLVVIAESSFVGTPALDEYMAQKIEFNPVVVDVEDIYNAVGFGMALPSAITNYLAARNQIYPFTHVQLVGSDCYDRLNYISECVSFIPLPTAPVAPTLYAPSQNRLVDLDGDGVADLAVGQFSVRSEHELATVVGKEASWHASGLSSGESVLLIAEESDGVHDFLAQVDRFGRHFESGAAEVLDMTMHPDIETAREALRLSLDAGRAVTVFSGHSSAFRWAFRGLLTPNSVQALTNFDRPTIMLPLACQTSYDSSPNANVLGHQLLYAGDQGALAISGAVALSSLDDNERMADHILDGLRAGLTLGKAVQVGREALGHSYQTLQDNWATQGDVTLRMDRQR